ncbi:VOC family protein [Caballeronia sp. SBC2]|uniref:VOC family protein n=1 Tax=Caballeronia sp. SBC2 TaxID=2705547 RepID=UPI0013E1E3AB|nr:Glyoxalase/Bleomycin resistance protein/Dioxygenase superfamily protein [Caballeronia sp. SBC2]
MNVGHVNRIVQISRNVTELGRSVAFYQERLGFQPSGPVFRMEDALVDLLGFGHHAVNVQRLRLGTQELELVEAGPHARPYPLNSTSADLWFQHFAICCNNIQNAVRQLYRPDSTSVLPAAISGRPGVVHSPIRLPANSGGATAFKFRDPDGHPVELIQFPGDTGARQAFNGKIDHSAISISNVEASVDFYTGILGLTVGTHQTNSGHEQGILDALHDAVVEVVALRTFPQMSPHIELLGYRSPVGTALRHVASPTDIASDRIVLHLNGLRGVVAALNASSQVVRLVSHESAALIRDPDGHLLMLIE